MCKHLGINANTFRKLKQKYPKIQEAIDEAKLQLKKDLASAMYKKAVGFETFEEEQIIEETGKIQKRRIHRTKKQHPPDYKAIVYLLETNFGKELKNGNSNDEYNEFENL